jgi:hypothetical protein
MRTFSKIFAGRSNLGRVIAMAQQRDQPFDPGK